MPDTQAAAHPPKNVEESLVLAMNTLHWVSSTLNWQDESPAELLAQLPDVRALVGSTIAEITAARCARFPSGRTEHCL